VEFPRRSSALDLRHGKLRLNSTNQSKEAIEVLEATRTNSEWDVRVQHPFG